MSRLADDVLRRLREDIVSGVHPPGARLTETSLCTAYDVSRVPVREALKQLEVEGFVDARAYAGVTVTRLSADEADDLFAVRRTIETQSAARCAQRVATEPATPLLAELDRLVEVGCASASRDPGALPPLNTRFHLALAELSGSSSLLSLLRQVSAKIQWLYAMDLDVRAEHSWTEHREILDAVRAGDAERARAAMGRHIERSREGYVSRHARSILTSR